MSLVETLQARVADLEAENAWLRSEFGLLPDEDRRSAALGARFSLTPSQAAIVLRLYAAKGQTVCHGVLHEVASRNTDMTGPEIVKVQICRARKLLGGGIENVHGFGYRLTAEALVRLAAILDPQPVEAAA